MSKISFTGKARFDDVSELIKSAVCCCVVFVLMLGGALTTPLRAQGAGSVAGTITDSTGAVVQNATISLKNLGTNEVQTVKTGTSGEYRFVNVLPANYSVTIDAPSKSFKRFVQDAVKVEVDSTIRVDAKLTVGAADETVEVSTAPPLLDTESGTIGSVVEGKTVEETPLNGRNIMNLVALTPGVIPGNNSMGAPGLNSSNHTDITGFGNYSVGGGNFSYTSDYVDGAPDNVLTENSVGFIPTQDATQEFKVSSNAVSAEYGRFGGGIVEISTKSGANKFHGSVYEYFRNTVLNANAFGNAGSPVAKWNQNQYGASVTGPIKRDKSFFMFSWESYAQVTAAPDRTNVPGDGTNGTTNQAGYAAGSNVPGSAPAVFSDLGGTRVIQDPTGRCPAGAITHNVSAGTYTIPTSCFDPVGIKLLQFWGKPNSPLSSGSNFIAHPSVGDNTTQYNGRVDHNLTNKQKLFARYTFWKVDDVGQNPMAHTTATLPSQFAGTHVHSMDAVLGDTYTVNSSTVADLRLSYLRQVFRNLASTYNSTDESQFGSAYATLAGQETFHSIPNINFGGPGNTYNNIQFIIPQGAVQLEQSNVYALNLNLTKIVGTHSLKFGGEGRLSERDSVGNNPDYGGWGFFTAGLPFFSIGDEIAALEMGVFMFNNINTVTPATTFNYSYGLYGTDTWRANRNLTLTFGLRYELPGGMEEKKDRATVLLPGTVDPALGYGPTLALVNSALYSSRSMEPERHDLFSPRFSFAQRLGDSTVVRGGADLIFLSPDLSGGVQAFNSPINGAQTQSNNLTPAGPFYENNPFPHGIITPIGRKYATFGTYLASTATSPLGAISPASQVLQGPVPNGRYPSIMQYNLSISHQWHGGWTTEAAAVGAQGTHLPIAAANGTPDNSAFGLDQIPTGSYDGNGNATVGPYTGTPLSTSKPCAALGGANVSVGQCLRPFPGYKDVQDLTHNTGSSTYDALYLTVQKRFGSGGTINANYTWFKSIDDVGTASNNNPPATWQDFYNQQGNRSLSAFDVDQRLNISYVLDLPFGKGKRWANYDGFGGGLVSGWALNGITTLQAGAPLAFVTGGNSLSSNYGSGIIRPNLVAGCNLKTSGSSFQRFQSNNWFNKSCLVAPADFHFGNAPVRTGAVRAMGQDNFDLSLVKSTQVWETVNAQFRFEVFNLFNHAQINTPGLQLGSSNFDVVTGTLAANNPRLIQLALRIKF